MNRTSFAVTRLDDIGHKQTSICKFQAKQVLIFSYFWWLYPSYVVVTFASGESIKWETSLEQQNRAAQNWSLIKTLLFVSTTAVLSWLPFIIVTAYLMGIQGIFVPQGILYRNHSHNYFNSLVNLIIYALRIPDFKQHLTVCCSIHRVVDGMKSKYAGRSNDRIAAGDVTSLPADLSHLQLASEQDERVLNDTELWK